MLVFLVLKVWFVSSEEHALALFAQRDTFHGRKFEAAEKTVDRLVTRDFRLRNPTPMRTRRFSDH